MSATPALHLILGAAVTVSGKQTHRIEDLLVERAVSGILRSVRAAAGTDDVPVDRLRAGEVSTVELAELLSPSLFAEERVIVLDAADEAGKDAATLVAAAAADLPPGTVLVVIHSGGGRAKTLATQLRSLEAQIHSCGPITRPAERAEFVRGEFRAMKVKVDADAVAALLDAVGSDIRELASACSQLVADTGGQITEAAVRRYHVGAEVSGFDIADKAVAGDVAGATEALRWARARGVAEVLIADALAEAVHSIARVGPHSGNPDGLVGELKMPSWRIRKVQKQARRWSTEKVTDAIRMVAALNSDVKGGAADADYALEAAVRRVAELAAGR